MSSPNRDHKYDYLVTRPAYSYRTEKSARLLARNDINMELRRVASHYSGNEPLPALLPLQDKPGPSSAYCDVSQLLI